MMYFNLFFRKIESAIAGSKV